MMASHPGPAEALLRRGGISQCTTPSWTTARDVKEYAAAGFGAIGIWLHKLERGTYGEFYVPTARIDETVVAHTSTAVRRAALQVSHLVLAGFFTNADAELRSQRIAHARGALAVAANLGANCLIIAPGSRNGASETTARRRVVSALSAVLDGDIPEVPLAIEPVASRYSDFINTLGEALDLVEAVDHPALGVYVDVSHLWETPSLYDDVARAGARILGCHVADGFAGRADRVPPGEGEIPLGQILGALELAGYRGTYDIELVREPADQAPTDAEARQLVARCAAGLEKVLREAL